MFKPILLIAIIFSTSIVDAQKNNFYATFTMGAHTNTLCDVFEPINYNNYPLATINYGLGVKYSLFHTIDIECGLYNFTKGNRFNRISITKFGNDLLYPQFNELKYICLPITVTKIFSNVYGNIYPFISGGLYTGYLYKQQYVNIESYPYLDKFSTSNYANYNKWDVGWLGKLGFTVPITSKVKAECSYNMQFGGIPVEDNTANNLYLRYTNTKGISISLLYKIK